MSNLMQDLHIYSAALFLKSGELENFILHTGGRVGN